MGAETSCAETGFGMGDTEGVTTVVCPLTAVSCGVWGPTVGVACGAVVAGCTEAEGTGVPDSCGFEGAGEPAGWLESGL